MGKFRINGPNGEEFEIEAPDDATDDQVMQYFQTNLPKPEAKAEGPKIGATQSAILGASQGATFGFMDEIASAGSAAIAKATGNPAPYGALYDAALKVPRMAQDAAEEQNPVAYYGGQVAAGLAPAAFTGGVGAIPSVARSGLGARSAAAAGEGATYGALFGAGSSEGGALERAKGAGLGAAVGGVLGAATPAAVDVGAAAVRGFAAPIKGMLSPERFGMQKYAEASLRDLNPSGDLARKRWNTSDNVRRLRAETGKDLRDVDLGGQNTRRLVKLAGSMPGTGANKLNKFLDTRQGNQWRRIERDMSGSLGNPADYARTLDDIVAARSQQAAPDFDAAMNYAVQLTPQLDEVISRPAIQRLIGEVSENMANEGAAFNGLPPMQALHRIKLELDEQLTRARKARDMGQSPTAGMDMRTLTILKKDFVSAIDNPAYRTALDNFAGKSALKNALEDGRDSFFKMDPEEIAPHLASMTASERDMWRLGAARAIAGKNRKGNINFDRTDRDFSSPEITERLQGLFPDNASRREFQKRLVLESKMADSRKAVQNNSSTFQQSLQGEEAGKDLAIAGAAANAAAGRFGPILDALAQGKNRLTGITPRSAEAIIDAGLSKGDYWSTIAFENALMRARKAPDSRNALVTGVLRAENAGTSPFVAQDGLRGGIGPRYDENGRLKPGQGR